MFSKWPQAWCAGVGDDPDVRLPPFERRAQHVSQRDQRRLGAAARTDHVQLQPAACRQCVELAGQPAVHLRRRPAKMGRQIRLPPGEQASRGCGSAEPSTLVRLRGAVLRPSSLSRRRPTRGQGRRSSLAPPLCPARRGGQLVQPLEDAARVLASLTSSTTRLRELLERLADLLRDSACGRRWPQRSGYLRSSAQAARASSGHPWRRRRCCFRCLISSIDSAWRTCCSNSGSRRGSAADRADVAADVLGRRRAAAAHAQNGHDFAPLAVIERNLGAARQLGSLVRDRQPAAVVAWQRRASCDCSAAWSPTLPSAFGRCDWLSAWPWFSSASSRCTRAVAAGVAMILERHDRPAGRAAITANESVGAARAGLHHPHGPPTRRAAAMGHHRRMAGGDADPQSAPRGTTAATASATRMPMPIP